MREEYSALIKIGTWSLLDIPPGKMAIGSKWIFNVKKGEEGYFIRLKARPVAEGCSPQYGIKSD